MALKLRCLRFHAPLVSKECPWSEACLICSNTGAAQVDANAYISELTREVEGLKSELVSLKQQKENEKLQDLLAYVQNLESQEMASKLSPSIGEKSYGYRCDCVGRL